MCLCYLKELNLFFQVSGSCLLGAGVYIGTLPINMGSGPAAHTHKLCVVLQFHPDGFWSQLTRLLLRAVMPKLNAKLMAFLSLQSRGNEQQVCRKSCLTYNHFFHIQCNKSCLICYVISYLFQATLLEITRI